MLIKRLSYNAISIVCNQCEISRTFNTNKLGIAVGNRNTFTSRFSFSKSGKTDSQNSNNCKETNIKAFHNVKFFKD